MKALIALLLMLAVPGASYGEALFVTARAQVPAAATRCDDLSASCYCYESHEGPATSEPFDGGLAWDFDGSTSKECDLTNATVGETPVRIYNPNAADYGRFNHTKWLGDLPSHSRNNPTRLASYFVVIGDDWGEAGGGDGYVGWYHGEDSADWVSWLSSRRRVAVRYYVYHTDASDSEGAFPWVPGAGSCNQWTKWRNAECDDATGQDYWTTNNNGFYTETWLTGNCALADIGNQWLASRFTQSDEFNGSWVRVEIVIDNPEGGPSGSGLRMRAFLKDVTNESAEVKMYDSYDISGCPFCDVQIGTNQDALDPITAFDRIIFNYYGQGPDCPGARAMAGLLYAGWTNAELGGFDQFGSDDVSYRIGSDEAFECVNGEINPNYAAECN